MIRPFVTADWWEKTSTGVEQMAQEVPYYRIQFDKSSAILKRDETATSFTPYYAAPEQIGNKVKDERTDIWQFDVILYELVTGELPFKGDNMIEIGMNIASKDPIPPGKSNLMQKCSMLW